MKLSINDLKNVVKVATHTGTMESFSAKILDENKDILIIVDYSPMFNLKEDIYPYWKVKLQNEEQFKSIFFNKNELKEVRDVYNDFMQTGIII